MKIEARYLPPQEGIIAPYLFNRLLIAGKIVDGRAGGLIFGRTIEEGGIMVIAKLGTEYVIQGFIEGGSFALNWRAATGNLSRLKAMNAGLTLRELTKPLDPEAPEIADLILTHARPHPRIVFTHWAQFIVSAEPTAKHLAELVTMNREGNPYHQCDLNEIFHCVPGTEDGII